MLSTVLTKYMRRDLGSTVGRLSLFQLCNRSFATSLPASKLTVIFTYAKILIVINIDYYTDPSFYQRERSNLLGPAWQVVTHESALIQDENFPATYVAETIAGFPCIITRNTETGVVTGHLNICRHRGGPMEVSTCLVVVTANFISCIA